MATRRDILEKSILRRNFARVIDPHSPITIHDQIALRERHAIQAVVQDVSVEEKIRSKISLALLKVFPVETPRAAADFYQTVTSVFEENREAFLTSDPDACMLTFRKIQIPNSPPRRAFN